MEYVHRARSRLEEEKGRAILLDLPAQTRSALLRIVETELIERHAKTLVDMEGSGFAAVLKGVVGGPAAGSVARPGSGGGSDGDSGVAVDRDRVRDLANALGERARLDGRRLVRDQEN